MKTLVAILMKDPAQAKTRLADVLSPAQRERMAIELFHRAQRFFATQFGQCERLVVTPSARIAEQATASGSAVLMEPEARGLNRAAAAAFAWARDHGFEKLLLIPADIPVWLQSEIDQLLRAGFDHDVVVARAHDGGTNALLIDLTRCDRFDFCFGDDSAQHHAERATASGRTTLTRQWPFLARDIDTVDDCLVLSQELASLSSLDIPSSRA